MLKSSALEDHPLLIAALLHKLKIKILYKFIKGRSKYNINNLNVLNFFQLLSFLTATVSFKF